MSKILTIIVPAYNMEKYLERGMKSLILTSDLMKKLEVIIVNDGSKDKTSEIAHNFEKKYKETFKVIDKKNGNYGSCINEGLKIAKGIFIKILDADDVFITKNFEKFVIELIKSEIYNEKIDMFFMDYHIENDEYKSSQKCKQKMAENQVININSESQKVLFSDIQHHCIAYRTSILHKIEYKQTEGISYTDQEWITLPLLNVKSIKYIPIDVYEYFLGREGQTMDKKIIAKSVGAHAQIGETLINKYCAKKNTMSAYNKAIVEDRIISYYRYIYREFLVINVSKESEETIKRADGVLYNKDAEIYTELNKVTFSDKIRIKFIKIWRNNPNSILLCLLRFVYKLMHKR